jgi:hypothetical protein
VRVFLVGDSSFESLAGRYLSSLGREPSEKLGTTSADPENICRLILAKLQQHKARRLSITSLKDLFWVRFFKGESWQDAFISFQLEKNLPGAPGKFFPAPREGSHK